MKTGIELITEERQRQIDVEGWSDEHDDQYIYDELTVAASIYTLPIERRQFYGRESIPLGWPWSNDWYKPTPNDRVRELVKAGALIAAEIDRLQRQKS